MNGSRFDVDADYLWDIIESESRRALHPIVSTIPTARPGILARRDLPALALTAAIIIIALASLVLSW